MSQNDLVLSRSAMAEDVVRLISKCQVPLLSLSSSQLHWLSFLSLFPASQLGYYRTIFGHSVESHFQYNELDGSNKFVWEETGVEIREAGSLAGMKNKSKKESLGKYLSFQCGDQFCYACGRFWEAYRRHCHCGFLVVLRFT